MSEFTLGPLGRALSHVGTATGYAVRSYAEGGIQYAHVFAPEVGGNWPRCQVIGSETKRIGAPSEMFAGKVLVDKHPEVVLLFREKGRPPFVLDLVSNTEIVLEDTAPPSTVSAAATADSPNASIGSHVIAVGGSTLSVNPDGTLVIVPKGEMSIPLTADSPLRVYRNGGSDDAIPGAATTADQCNTIADSVNALTIRVKALEAALTAGVIEAAYDAALRAASEALGIKLGTELKAITPITGDDLAAPGITIPSKKGA